MTKSERLMYVLGLLKTQSAVHIAEIARECGVSERTIYRDINSLLKLGFVIQYRDGYKLTPEANLPVNSLDSSEVDLIAYCLRSNPLARQPFFRRQFQTIQSKLDQLGGHAGGPVIQVDTNGNNTVQAAEADLLAEFFRAVQMKRKIRVKTTNGRVLDEIFTPLSIVFDPDVHTLRIAADSGTIENIPVGEIAWIGMTDIPSNGRRFYTSTTAVREKQVDAVQP